MKFVQTPAAGGAVRRNVAKSIDQICRRCSLSFDEEPIFRMDGYSELKPIVVSAKFEVVSVELSRREWRPVMLSISSTQELPQMHTPSIRMVPIIHSRAD